MINRIIASLLIAGGLLFAGLVGTPAIAYAQQAQGECTTGSNKSFLGLPTWYKYLDTAPTLDSRCEISFSMPEDIPKILLAVFEIIMRIAGMAAIGFIIYGGFQYLISQGEPERTKGAKSTILNAIIGLVIALLSVAIVNLVARSIT